MTISIGSVGTQPKTELGESAVDRLTSSATSNLSRESEAGVADETTTLLAGTASIAALTNVAMNGDNSRMGKVEQLREAVAAGTYKPAPEGTADALLAEWR